MATITLQEQRFIAMDLSVPACCSSLFRDLPPAYRPKPKWRAAKSKRPRPKPVIVIPDSMAASRQTTSAVSPTTEICWQMATFPIRARRLRPSFPNRHSQFAD